MNKKGQAAMEYLMTYGWALLIILVVGAVLWYYGVFSPSKFVGKQQTCGQLGIDDHYITSAGQLNIKFRNTIGKEINITSVAGVAQNKPTVKAGKVSDQITVDGVVSAGSSGDPYDTTISVTYDIMGGGMSHTDTCHLIGKME